MSPATLRTTKCPQNSLMYSAAFILCKLDSALIGEMQQQDMKFVSIYPYSSLSDNILRDPDGKLSNILKINVPPPEEIEEPHQFSLCVQPTFSYNNVFEFVQWLEFHKMMGVSHFSFYNMSIGPTVSCVMKSMAVNQDTPIHVLQWTTPSPDHLILHVNGQIAQGNDCAFRYRGVSKYVVFVDFDECIIPNYVYARNYDELIEVLDEKWKNTFGRNRTVAQYQFRGGFFGWDFGKFPSSTFKNNTNSGQIELEDLEIYKHVIRQKGLLSYKHRSKLITIPRRIIEPGVHSIDEAVDDGVEFEVPHKVAYLHHYRQYGCGRNCTFTPQETDFVGHFFALTLLQNVRHMISKLTQECDLKSVKEWRRDNNHVR
ncbi:beta-1,4-galactosyltransferase galt-1-like isoform X2 [Folsomia candida]|nr:beta-1,4-galactosyltransferase galt-1-like isoform X2 [Folsomia candida]